MRISDWSSDVCSSDLFRDTRKSRAIALIALPPAYSRRIRTTVSKTNIPISPPDYPGRCLNHRNEGSLLDADHPANGVLFARRSTGPGSHVNGLADHPVVHVTHQDAAAYARWVKKALPSEAEWEYAARGGLECKDYAWGDEFEPNGVSQAKTWQGQFPHENLAPAGLERTAPVRSYLPNGFGLYDMIGNVWEWTDDWYDMRKFDPADRKSTRLNSSH